MIEFLRNPVASTTRFYFRNKIRRQIRTSFKLRTCDICENDRFEPLKVGDRFGLPIVTAKCENCSLIMTNPGPTEQFLRNFYSGSSYRGLYKGQIFKKDLEFDNAAEKAAVNLDHFRQLVEQFNILRAGKLLDYGCAVGRSMAEIKNAFPQSEVFGIEAGADTRAIAEKVLKHVWASIDEIDPGYSFELITVFHVLEHLYSPKLFLSETRKLLSPGGIMVVEVPNFELYSGSKPFHVGHIFHFTPKTFSNLCNATGMKILYQEPNFTIDKRFGMRFVLTSI